MKSELTIPEGKGHVLLVEMALHIYGIGVMCMHGKRRREALNKGPVPGPPYIFYWRLLEVQSGGFWSSFTELIKVLLCSCCTRIHKLEA